MNIIPTTFNEHDVSYTTIFGGQKSQQIFKLPISAVVLNRSGRHYRSAAFKNLTDFGIPSIISFENSSRSHDIEVLSAEYPRVRFILPSENLTIGEMINIAIAESDTPLVLVLWSDVRISALLPRITDDIVHNNHVCVTPSLVSNKGEMLPTQIVPSLQGANFSTEKMPCLRDNTATIYPYDFIGLYHKKKFIQIGGFDYTIKNAYWQNLDFGMRSFLWGEHISYHAGLRMNYESEPIPENISADASYRQFYLKNLAPSQGKDGAVIRFSTFWPYLKNSGLNPFNALTHFRTGRRWVEKNKTRFVTSASNLTEKWDPII